MARYLKKPNRQVIERVRAEAFAALTPEGAAAHHLGVVPRTLARGHVLDLVDRKIEVPDNAVVVFEDQMPGANFGHPCRYFFHSPEDGSLIGVAHANFPPEVADPVLKPEYFHEPLRIAHEVPSVYGRIDWDRFAHLPWLVDDNRYALLWTSQISNRRHVEDIEFAWRILRHRFGFRADHIYVLCYDGTIGSTDFHGADMATWVGDGTAYEMQIHAAATQANLESTLATISSRMNEDSLLFVHTNNHGAPSGLCIDNSGVVTPAEWATMLDAMDPFGTLVVTMEQCYSGAFLQPTLDHSKAARTSFASAVPADKVSAGDAHFDQWARTWFEAVNGSTAYGASLGHQPDTSGNGRVSVREAFDYSVSYEYPNYGYDDPQYGDSPAGCGSSIHLSKAPTLFDIIKELLKRYRAIEKVVPKHPEPDPAPDWAEKLLASLVVAEELESRMARTRLR
jgi:hypothetical protein